MAGTSSQSVDQYIAALPEPAAERLRAIRAAIREAVPEASETIAYQMPAYRYHGTLLYFGAFANHYSLFGPNVGALLEAFPVELEPYTRSKGTIRFPLNDPPPAELVGRLARHCAEVNLAREREKRERAAVRRRESRRTEG